MGEVAKILTRALAMPLSSNPAARRSSVWMLLLAVPIGLAGNPFLAICGSITAALVLCSSSSDTSNAAEPVVALSFVTVFLAVANTAGAVGAGIFTLLMSGNQAFDRRACLLSTRIVAASNSTFASTRFKEHGAFSADERTPAPSRISPDALSYLESLRQTLCGDDAPSFLFAIGGVILVYALVFAMPFTLHAARIGSIARRAGGCGSCVPTAVVVNRAPVAQGVVVRPSMPVVARPMPQGGTAITADARQMF